MSNLKCAGYSIVCEEVPNEVSLAINISGCPHHCEGCHSSYLSEDVGVSLIPELKYLLERYKDYVTCVCFMGGDFNIEELRTAFRIVKDVGLKTANYSGGDSVECYSDAISNGEIDYLKIGHYDKDLGPLNSRTTNQIFYTIKDKTIADTTYLFWK